MDSVELVLLMVGLATVVAVAARKLSVPAPSLLVVAGLIIGLLPAVPLVHLVPEVVSLVVLPPLVYAAGEELSFRDLKQVWKPVTVLAVGLVAASAAVVAAVAVALTPLSWTAGLLLGAVLASTDPVAVTALGRRLSLPPRLQALVQAESLFNDATSLILFRIAVGLVVGTTAVHPGNIALEFIQLAFGGAAIGAAVAGVIAVLRKLTLDPVVETVISLVTPYLAYVAAERLHGSGITAVVVAAVILGALAPRLTDSAARLQLHAVHATAVFILESVVFGLIGLQLPTLIREERGSWLLPAVMIVTVLLAVRVLWVFPMALLRQADGTRIRWQIPAVVSWAGARGVVPLAAALSIPLLAGTGEPLPGRGLILVTAIAVIVISLVMQGFTLAPLVTWAGVSVPGEHRQQELATAWAHITDVGTGHIDDLEAQGAVAPHLAEQARRSIRAVADLATDVQPDSAVEVYRQIRQEALNRQTASLHQLYQQRQINDATRRQIQHLLDLETERLRSTRH